MAKPHDWGNAYPARFISPCQAHQLLTQDSANQSHDEYMNTTNLEAPPGPLIR